MIGKLTNTVIYTPASLKAATAQNANTATDSVARAPQAATDSSVSISAAARQQQAADAALTSTHTDAKQSDSSESTQEKAESFAYGALGMDHPDDVSTNSDEFYTAGQVLSALGTVATVLLAIA
ncbi:hypothetical protein L4C36_00900 [Photobacterium japonica]|uniref:hypothetical protein n=1 Tax=Photobacterium japonica TaxID=2910235 RepID=UPI003D146E5C